MKKLQILLFTILYVNFTYSQEKMITKQGYISFLSNSAIEEIKAENNQALCIMDKATGDIAITLLMKSFVFEKSLMQEHFNENYVESDKFPKASFKGKILNLNKLDKQEQIVTIDGDLTIHGVTKKVQIKGKVINSENSLSLAGSFNVNVADYKIEIPSIVANNIAKTIKVNFDFDYKPFK
jgi:YceI-like domain